MPTDLGRAPVSKEDLGGPTEVVLAARPVGVAAQGPRSSVLLVSGACQGNSPAACVRVYIVQLKRLFFPFCGQEGIPRGTDTEEP